MLPGGLEGMHQIEGVCPGLTDIFASGDLRISR